MKPHPMLTADMIMQAMRDESKSIRRHQPFDEGDPFDRAPDQRELAEMVKMRELFAEKNDDVFRTLCIGCEQDVAMSQCTPCVCGGFVCPDCCASEEDGVCDHEPPEL